MTNGELTEVKKTLFDEALTTYHECIEHVKVCKIGAQGGVLHKTIDIHHRPALNGSGVSPIVH